MAELKHYSFWVQSVLPLVYDNSLSYYEVLGKCVDYINNLIDNDNEMLASMEEMQGAIEELRQMVIDAGITDINELKAKVIALENKTENLPNYETDNPVMDGTASAGSSTKYSRGDHVHPTDTSRASVESVGNVKNMISNRNIVENWYFVGGGSQLGDGIFPINQREQTTYNSSGISIDRWSIAADMAITINDSHIAITNSNTTTRKNFSQKIAKPIQGKTVTGSILTAEGNLYSGTVEIPQAAPSSTQYLEIATFDGNTIRIVYYTSGSLDLSLMVAADSTINIKAIKIELGTAQTLAHQESNVWILNELPDYADELAKCQRYYLRITNASASIPVATGYAANANSTTPVFYLPTPVTMAKVPTASFTGNIGVYPPNSAGIVMTSITRAFVVSVGVAILTEIASEGPQGGGYVLRPSTGAVIELSAE